MKESSVKKKTWVLLAVFTLLIVALDQLTKLLTVKHIPFGGDVAVIRNVLHLTYVQNEGAAFSMLSGMRWLFVVLVAVYFAVLALLIKKKVFDRPAELWCLAAISGGAVGNLIDRIATGKVTDMIDLRFLKLPLPSFTDGHLKFAITPFAIFNVADIFITCGVIALAVCILFFSGKKQKKEKSDDTAQ